ncbi:hypothetical protein L3Y34_001144 [Caenorhabditis briggsae]|uniref:Uncharacterized protein n=3 Tax=Caenorhabditis briggsae TaxID=6238 RepID=A0AAE9DB87_CAEBR|nr:hypothetical protein L3Y34_001144 [Caenorhabditis briggsae]
MPPKLKKMKSMSDNSIDPATLAAAAAIVAGARNPGSAEASRNPSPPVPGVPAPVPVPLVTVSSTTSTPLLEQAKNALAQLVKTSKMNRSRGSALAEKPEVQLMLDKDLFLIQSDRRTKMNPLQQMQLLRVLSQFFLERVDDGHRYAYFEAIFLGRVDDPVLHEYRLSVMYQLVSFSVQYPVLQILNHVMGWISKLNNETQERMYCDRLIDMMVEHFVRTSNIENRMHDYLLPLETSCSEFCALFIARAPLHGPLSPAMVEVIVQYCATNMQFILRHLRDTPWQGNDFAEKVIPRLVEQMLVDETDDSDSLGSCICYFLFRWHIDVLANADRKGPTKRIEVLDLLLSPEYPWTKRRACVLTSAIAASTRSEEVVQKQLKKLFVPVTFKPAVELLCSGTVKDNPQKVLEALSEMTLTRELRALAGETN